MSYDPQRRNVKATALRYLNLVLLVCSKGQTVVTRLMKESMRDEKVVDIP